MKAVSLTKVIGNIRSTMNIASATTAATPLTSSRGQKRDKKTPEKSIKIPKNVISITDYLKDKGLVAYERITRKTQKEFAQAEDLREEGSLEKLNEKFSPTKTVEEIPMEQIFEIADATEKVSNANSQEAVENSHKSAFKLSEEQKLSIAEKFENAKEVENLLTAENQHNSFKQVLTNAKEVRAQNGDTRPVKEYFGEEIYVMLESIPKGEEGNNKAAETQVLYKMMEKHPELFGKVREQKIDPPTITDEPEPEVEEINLSDTPIPDYEYLTAKSIKEKFAGLSQEEPKEQTTEQSLSKEEVVALQEEVSNESLSIKKVNIGETPQKILEETKSANLPQEAIEKAYMIEHERACLEGRVPNTSFFLTPEEEASLSEEFKARVANSIEKRRIQKLKEIDFGEISPEFDETKEAPELTEEGRENLIQDISKNRAEKNKNARKNARVYMHTQTCLANGEKIKNIEEISEEFHFSEISNEVKAHVEEVINGYHAVKAKFERTKDLQISEAQMAHIDPSENKDLYDRAFTQGGVARGAVRTLLNAKDASELKSLISSSVTKQINVNEIPRESEPEFDAKRYAERKVKSLEGVEGKEEQREARLRIIQEIMVERGEHMPEFQVKDKEAFQQLTNQEMVQELNQEDIRLKSNGKVVNQNGQEVNPLDYLNPFEEQEQGISM